MSIDGWACTVSIEKQNFKLLIELVKTKDSKLQLRGSYSNRGDISEFNNRDHGSKFNYRD